MTTDNLDVKKWIAFAQRDYNTALRLPVTHHPVPIEIVCYLCQQAAEKILKAYAIANGEPLKKTHNLDILLDQCKKHSSDFDTLYDISEALTDHEAASRYPPEFDMTDGEMRIALKDAKTIMDFTMAKLKEAGY